MLRKKKRIQYDISIFNILVKMNQEQLYRGVLSKTVFDKFRKTHVKTVLLEPPFNKVARLHPAALLKRESITSIFLSVLQNF